MKNGIVAKMSGTVSKIGFKLQKHSPEILIAVGVVGVVASTVLACKATTKLNETINEDKKKIDEIHEKAIAMEEEPDSKALTVAYAHTALDVTKLYAPSVVLGAASITSIIVSHNILKNRNVALSAALGAVTTSFNEYRARVRERFGEDLDRELRYDMKSADIEETTTTEDGLEVTTRKTVTGIEGGTDLSDYARWLDSSCTGVWSEDIGQNITSLRMTQQYFNDKLHTEGHVFLNDVYKELGMQPTKAGQVVGWYDDPKLGKDNYIDFGIFKANRFLELKEGVNIRESEAAILLDFNVDGPIYDLDLRNKQFRKNKAAV